MSIFQTHNILQSIIIMDVGWHPERWLPTLHGHGTFWDTIFGGTVESNVKKQSNTQYTYFIWSLL